MARRADGALQLQTREHAACAHADHVRTDAQRASPLVMIRFLPPVALQTPDSRDAPQRVRTGCMGPTASACRRVAVRDAAPLCHRREAAHCAAAGSPLRLRARDRDSRPRQCRPHQQARAAAVPAAAVRAGAAGNSRPVSVANARRTAAGSCVDAITFSPHGHSWYRRGSRPLPDPCRTELVVRRRQ